MDAVEIDREVMRGVRPTLPVVRQIGNVIRVEGEF
jgi:hypothetical protein